MFYSFSITVVNVIDVVVFVVVDIDFVIVLNFVHDVTINFLAVEFLDASCT